MSIEHPIRSASSLIIAAPIPGANDKNSTNFKILMLKRNAKSSFINAYVYPGGVVDKADDYKNWSQSNLTEQEGYILTNKICAIRETFEECGLLLCSNANKVPSEELNVWRNKVHNDAQQFKVMCDQYQIWPQVDRLIPYSNWITPAQEKRRYNTLFFLTVLDQEYSNQKEHDLYFGSVKEDGKELVLLEWLKPEEAISLQKDNKILLIPPQWYTLSTLKDVPDYKDLESKAGLDVFRTQSGHVLKILPQSHFTDDGIYLAYPGDEAYASQEYTSIKGNRHRLNFTGRMENYRLERNIVASAIIKQKTSHL